MRSVQRQRSAVMGRAGAACARCFSPIIQYAAIRSDYILSALWLRMMLTTLCRGDAAAPT